MKLKKFNEMAKNLNEEDYDEEPDNNGHNNNNKEMFINALSGLFYSWGSDTPPEVFWGCNQLLDWYDIEFDVQLNIRFNEENPNVDEVLEAIRNN